MPEVATELKTFRFDQMAVQVKDKVHPVDADVDRYVGLEHIDPESLKIRRWGEPGDVESTKILFRAGDIIFGKRRAYQRKLAVADFDGICSAHALVLRPKTDVVLQEFLPFFMQTDTFMERAVKISVGGLSPTINWKDLAREEFSLPPIGEQRRIASALLAVERTLTACNELADRAWSVNIGNYKRVTGVAASKWTPQPISSALEITNTLRKPISAGVRARMRGSYPYFGATGQLDSISEYRLDGTYALIGEDGDHFLKYNKQSMTQLVSGRFNVNNHAHVLHGTDQCLTEWFFHYYRHQDVRPWLSKQGSGRLKLKKATLESMPIAVPPLDTQRHLIQELEASVDAFAAASVRRSRVRALKSKLLATIVEGGMS